MRSGGKMGNTAIISMLPLFGLLIPSNINGVELANDLIRAAVHKEYPLIMSYKRIAIPAYFGGADPDERWEITIICPDRTDAVIRNDDIRINASFTQDHAEYVFSCHINDENVLKFTANISLEADQVVYRITQIESANGYSLRKIDFGKGIRVYMKDGAPDGSICGGTLGRDRNPYFFENMKDVKSHDPQNIDMIMLCQSGAVAVGYNNLIIHPWCFQSHSQGSDLAEFWCPPYIHTVTAGTGDNYTTAVLNDFVCRIGVLGDYSGDGEVDWRDGAAFIRDQLHGCAPLFQDYMRYEANDDFDKFIDVVRKIYYITDGRLQLCLHAAWQYWGWDSEYPAYMEPNDEYGGREALYRLMREASKYRCIVSLIHNFDDSYKDSPAWNEDIIIRRDDQSLQEATAWAGGRSFINSPFKMIKLGWAKKVIDGLAAQGARLRLFSDVLSAVPERVDYDKNMPSDALANLVLGKFKIIEMLKEQGITVGSESATWAFIGKICTAHSMSLGMSEDPSVVPLGPFVLHGKMAYQSWSHGRDTFLAGADNTTGWDNDVIYLWAMVLEQYANKPMTNYTRKDGLFRTEFGADTFVECQKGTSGVKVVVDGRLISNGKSCMIPKKTPNVYLVYSTLQSPQRYPKPKGWNDMSQLLAYRLSDGPEKQVNSESVVSFDGNDIILTLFSQTPYRLCYGREAYIVDKQIRETPFDQPTITWEPDKVIESNPSGQRPSWIRKSTRVDPPGTTLYVGCGAKFPTEAQSRLHAASIVARKLTWQVRQGFVNRSREYEKQLGLDINKLGFDNWNIGLNAVNEMYSMGKINAIAETQWYVEKLENYDPQQSEPKITYKAYVAIPITPKQLHDVYVESIRYNLNLAKKSLISGDGNEAQLQNRIKLWTFMLEEESKKQQ
jgi:hypothetical protein